MPDAQPKSYLIDMDGVMVRGNIPIPGAREFIDRLQQRGAKYAILTNNSKYTPQDLQHRLEQSGLPIGSEHLFTSALATARFLQMQRPGGTAFVIGEIGLIQALYEVGYTMSNTTPDYVVLGETDSYSLQAITHAIRLLIGGARFIATNPDPSGPSEAGIVPACGAVAALIEKASGVTPYFVGKPNPLMMRLALRAINEHSENAVMVGDRMDTDMIAGIESGLDTILVLSGVTAADDVPRFAYRPGRIVGSVAEIEV